MAKFRFFNAIRHKSPSYINQADWTNFLGQVESQLKQYPLFTNYQVIVKQGDYYLQWIFFTITLDNQLKQTLAEVLGLDYADIMVESIEEHQRKLYQLQDYSIPSIDNNNAALDDRGIGGVLLVKVENIFKQEIEASEATENHQRCTVQ